jgi:hypothetical protein
VSLSPFLIRLTTLAATVALLGLGQPTPVPSPSPSAKPKTPCMNDIPVEMLSKVESANAIPGQVFRFRVKQTTTTVTAGTYAAGTLGYGVVRAVSKAGRHDQYGFVGLEPRYLLMPHGKIQSVSMDPTLPAVFTTETPNLEKAAGHIPNPIPGIMMTGINYLRFGKNVTIGPGFSFYVVPIGDLTKNGSC